MCTGAEPAVAAEAGAKGAADVVAGTAGADLVAAGDVAGAGFFADTATVAATGAPLAGSAAIGPVGTTIFNASSGISNILNTAKTVASIASPITSLMQTASGVSASKTSAAKSITNQPLVAPPVTMPTFGSADTLNAMRSNIQEQLVRRGRAATILTDSASGTKLGN